jgi:hypothetical protein
VVVVVARECGSGSEQSELSLTLHRRHLCEVEGELDEEGTRVRYKRSSGR